MKIRTLLIRNLVFFRRTNLAIILGVAIAVAVLSGALLVGESVRASLRRLVFERIGATEYIVASTHFFAERLAKSLEPGFETCPIIYLKGVVIHEGTRIQVHDVNVYGIDERFWRLNGRAHQSFAGDRSALVGKALARQLDTRTGDSLLLRVETQQAIPKEWLYGRRDSIGRTIRLSVDHILPEESLGEFALRPTQGNVFSIFVPLKRLQKDLEQTSRVNTILFRTLDTKNTARDAFREGLSRNNTLSDLGLKLRDLPSGRGISLETDRIILDDAVAQAAMRAANESNMTSSPVYTYLANSIRAKGREIPYSVISAVDLGKGAMESEEKDGNDSFHRSLASDTDSIWLSDWASKNLGVSIGDPVEIDYFLWIDSGQMVTRTARFRLAGVVAASGDLGASLAPEIPGITEARSISGWDPPFPLDLGRIRPEDEDFWNSYKAAPKAFIPLRKGQELWGNRFGRQTALRLDIPDGIALESGRRQFSAALLRCLDPQQVGFSIVAVREGGLAASRGTTDFGEYFIYFSSFLIAAAILLSALFFKLMVEQRVGEIGILRAAGFRIRTLQRIFLVEGIFLSVAGSILGILGSLGYAWLMIFGLRTWWIGAVGTRRLNFHISWPDLLLGALAGTLFSALAIWWTLRGLRRNSPRLLLTGILEIPSIRRKRTQTIALSASVALLGALLLLVGSIYKKISPLEGFFGSAALLLISILCATALYLRRHNPSPIRGNGWRAFIHLGMRNSMHKPGRSLVCASLIASATFIIISMEAFRQDTRSVSLELKSGTGGYPLVAEFSIPVIQDPNTEEGREALGIADYQPGTSGAKFVSFRERPGDDVSCLNLYAPQEPKILGAPHSFLAAGRFSFQESQPSGEKIQENPWLLLESTQDSSIVPAIADANTIQYILHGKVGGEIAVRGDDGKPVRLRFVAALRDSIFQGQLLISESNFLRFFPEHQGYRYFLLDVPKSRADGLRKELQEALSDWGADIESSQEILATYHRVENTYLSTFQSLGALGLLLGTAGLAAILLRNVLERRGELAILRAAGYSRRALSGIILAEHMVLACWGLISGSACALLAIVPAIHSRGESIPFISWILILLAVLAAGLISSLAAVITVIRSPLIAALNSE
jgi:putative ABC transport system permease protein